MSTREVERSLFSGVVSWGVVLYFGRGMEVVYSCRGLSVRSAGGALSEVVEDMVMLMLEGSAVGWFSVIGDVGGSTVTTDHAR